MLSALISRANPPPPPKKQSPLARLQPLAALVRANIASLSASTAHADAATSLGALGTIIVVLTLARYVGLVNALALAVAAGWAASGALTKRGPGVAMLVFSCDSEDVSRALLEELLLRRIIACGHIIPGIASLALIGTEVHEDVEVLVMATCQLTRVPDAVELVRRGYSGMVNVHTLNLHGGNATFLDWVLAATKHKPGHRVAFEDEGLPCSLGG